MNHFEVVKWTKQTKDLFSQSKESHGKTQTVQKADTVPCDELSNAEGRTVCS